MTDRTLARVAALLRKAEGTDNEHEAAAFMDAAQRIATAAAIDLAVARAHNSSQQQQAGPTQREVVLGEAGKRGLKTYVELFLAIARANDVTCDVARNSTRVFAYGFRADLDTSEALYASLVVQMVRASDTFITSGAYRTEQVRSFSPTQRRWVTRPVSGITARISFQRAYAARIARRLADARAATVAQARKQQCRSTVALALRAKEVAVADHYRRTSTARGHWRDSTTSAGVSRHAHRAGDTAARTARLGTEARIGGARRALGTGER